VIEALRQLPRLVWHEASRPWVFPLVTSATDIDIISLPMELGLHNWASMPMTSTPWTDLSPPGHDILKEITEVDMKEVPDAVPKVGDGKSEKLLASAEFPGDGTRDKESSVGD
jgi:hypothetical protein